YEAFSFDDDHIKEISSGSTTTHSDISLFEYDSFIFNFAHEEFVDKLTHIISPPEYDCFYFRNLPDQGELMSVLNSEIRENLSTTLANLPIEDDHSLLLAYVVLIFLSYLTYPVIPPYLHPFGNEDTIFDLGITIYHFYSFKPGSSHRHGAFKKFNTHRSHLNEWPMIINGKNTPILDVLLFHFYPPFGNEDTIFDLGITIYHFYSFKPGSSHRHGAFKKFNTHRSHLNEWPMRINEKNTPILDVLLIPGNLKTLAKGFYPPSLNFLSFSWES
nr:hypothetical protein [Tanacetum cinerariifolium]